MAGRLSSTPAKVSVYSRPYLADASRKKMTCFTLTWMNTEKIDGGERNENEATKRREIDRIILLSALPFPHTSCAISFKSNSYIECLFFFFRFGIAVYHFPFILSNVKLSIIYFICNREMGCFHYPISLDSLPKMETLLSWKVFINVNKSTTNFGHSIVKSPSKIVENCNSHW